ncbi:MAG: hypothetical protein ORO03_04550, partial [Alphaproteobacteria bacterium]|nr:hypothetical protein [Alphaproteobacteria bacterium]
VTGKRVMNGGNLTIVGRLEPLPRGLTASITVQKFRLTNTPGFNRLVGLLSVTGILDALSGDGLAFDELKMEVSHSGLLTRVIDGHVTGSALGLTVKGTLLEPNPTGPDADSSPRVDLEGTAVPAYGVSKTIKGIPLLGWLLTGSKGEGLIAFNYTVTGDLSNPKVGVNPLSVLAPGFMRNWFNSIKKNNGRSKPEAPSPTEQPLLPTTTPTITPQNGNKK